MKVHFMCAYYSQWAHTELAPRSQSQWDAFKFTRAVKSGRVNGYLTFPWKKGPEQIDSSNVGRAREIFGLFIDATMKDLGLSDASLIPVPSKDGLVGTDDYRSFNMVAEALQNRPSRALIEPILRFKTQMERAAAGGTRDRNTLAANMILTQRPRSNNVVLIDDIFTTGGSLLASYDVLAAEGYLPNCAICCAHTVSDSLTKAFGVHVREYDPNPAAF